MLPQPWIVLVEIINFLILVVLLQHFLYQPIMKTMAQREYSIAERLQSAERREQTAQAMTQAASTASATRDRTGHSLRRYPSRAREPTDSVEREPAPRTKGGTRELA